MKKIKVVKTTEGQIHYNNFGHIDVCNNLTKLHGM